MRSRLSRACRLSSQRRRGKTSLLCEQRTPRAKGEMISILYNAHSNIHHCIDFCQGVSEHSIPLHFPRPRDYLDEAFPTDFPISESDTYFSRVNYPPFCLACWRKSFPEEIRVRVPGLAHHMQRRKLGISESRVFSTSLSNFLCPTHNFWEDTLATKPHV